MNQETYPPASTFRGRLLHSRIIVRVAAALIVAAASLWVGGLFWFVSKIKDEPAAFETPADGIVVLTGGAERLNVALDLLKRGEAQRLLITGVHPETGASDLTENSVGTAELFACCIDLGKSAMNTRGNAVEAAEWAQAHIYKRLIIVTADYHMPRAMLEFRAAMPGAELIAYPVKPPDIRLKNWWRYPGTTKLLAGEYSKYLLALANAPAGKAPVRAKL
jgi:uncharacterized SAM-binding protein YcdF (DUF218 family)